jgi:hypothetical protein
MSYRQFIWGLSNGILVLTLAGGFWLGVIGSIVKRPEVLGPIGAVGVIALLWGFVSLRQKSTGFSLSEMKNGTPEQRQSLQRIRRGFRWIIVLEWVLSGTAVGVCEYLHRMDLIWPALGIAISLHFLPLGRLFRVRRYYFTGIVGTVACLIALVAFVSPTNTLFAASAMCLNMWGTAAWLLARSEEMARKAVPTSNAAAGSSIS